MKLKKILAGKINPTFKRIWKETGLGLTQDIKRRRKKKDPGMLSTAGFRPRDLILLGGVTDPAAQRLAGQQPNGPDDKSFRRIASDATCFQLGEAEGSFPEREHGDNLQLEMMEEAITELWI